MPYPWSANDILTAADLNAAIGTGIVSTGLGAWTSYTPTWTSTGVAPALGNGTLVGAYYKSGRLVVFRVALTMGTTTTYGTGAYTWSLPVTAAGSGTYPSGGMRLVDVSAAQQYMRHLFQNSTAVVAGIGDGASTFVTSTVPFTFANGDQVTIAGYYESAT